MVEPISAEAAEAESECVGPVLVAGPVTEAIIAAIQARNPAVTVTSRGSYYRVQAPERCTLLRSDAEEYLGHELVFPRDLELVLSSFTGSLTLSADGADWVSAARD